VAGRRRPGRAPQGPDGVRLDEAGRSGPLYRGWSAAQSARPGGDRAKQVTKRYDEPIEVTPDAAGAAPAWFSWRGRRYDIDQRLSQWREAGEWWDTDGHRDHEFFRVLAHPAGVMATGDLDADGFFVRTGAVYDVYLDRARGDWRLARIWD
jgi:hypothetical protein